MFPILLLLFALAAPADVSPWQEISLSIERDNSVSSDTFTLCRVRAANRGGHTWPGRVLAFEASAIDGGIVVARERGRFGLSLKPRETLETLVSFSGVYGRFEVRPLVKGVDRLSGSGRRKGASGSKRKGKSRARS